MPHSSPTHSTIQRRKWIWSPAVVLRTDPVLTTGKAAGRQLVGACADSESELARRMWSAHEHRLASCLAFYQLGKLRTRSAHLPITNQHKALVKPNTRRENSLGFLDVQKYMWLDLTFRYTYKEQNYFNKKKYLIFFEPRRIWYHRGDLLNQFKHF